VAVLLGAYLAWTMLTVLPSPSRWHSSVVGEHADSLLNVSVLDWVSHHLFDWHTLWQGQFFQPHPLTLAYSDVVLPQSLLFGVLRPIAGAAGAFNLIELLAWMLALWACHCLMRRFCPNDAAAFLGSVGWNFSTVRLTQLGSFQFVTAAALIPVVLLALLRFIDRPTSVRGAVLGLSLAGVTVAANYYGPMMVIAVAILGISVVLFRRDLGLRRMVAPLAVGAAVGAIVMVPVWWQYQRLQEDPYFRRSPVAVYSTRPSDLVGVSVFNNALDEAPLLHTAGNPLYPGVAVAVLGLAGGVITLTQQTRRKVEILALLGVGAFMLILSGGDHYWRFGADWFRPYRFVSAWIPGFAGIRAPARFAVLFELALAVSAVTALGGIKARSKGAFKFIVVVAIVVVMLESRVDPPIVRVPDRREWTAVNDVLRGLPRGLTIELPVVVEARGGSIIEAPRMVLARRDGHPRVNGYAGYEPPGYQRMASAVNRFPGPVALAWLQRHQIRYVIVRTGTVGHTDPKVVERLHMFQPHLARPAIERLLTDTPAWVSRVRRLGDAILVELQWGGQSDRVRSLPSR
jgi:hypothetical protein